MALILIDMDGVVVDLMGEAVARGLFQHPPCKWNFTGCCTPYEQDEIFGQYNIFRDPAPISGAVDGVAKLIDAGHDVRFVSTPWPTNHQSAQHKYEWIEEHFGKPRLLILTHDKTLIPASVLIDDRPNLTGPWTHITYPQAWNASSWHEPTWDDGLAEYVLDYVQIEPEPDPHQ